MSRALLTSLAAGALASACAFGGGGTLDDSTAGLMRGGAPSPAAALALIRAGNSKTDVAQALGRANVIAFDSGWEVWVYRWPGADRSTRSASELVVLFDASGVVRKVRTRAGA